MNTKLRYLLFAALFFMLSGSVVYAGDLDDGISKYSDDSISANDNLGDPDKNVKYIIMRAKSQAAMGNKKGQGATGDGNMNSVVMGAGSNVKGDIYIIDQSKGDKTQVVQ